MSDTEYIDYLVSIAPPLTQAQRDRIAALLVIPGTGPGEDVVCDDRAA